MIQLEILSTVGKEVKRACHILNGVGVGEWVGMVCLL